jgi:hypothetical protein
MKSTDLDRVMSSTPADKKAALVTGPGVHWEPQRPEGWPANSYEGPPKLRRVPDWVEDLTGHRYREMAVVGLIKAEAWTKWSLWLVRCRCGAWEDRTGAAVALRHGGRCWRCEVWERARTGRAPWVAQRRPKPPKDVVSTVLASKTVKRPPANAMQAALSRALNGKMGHE